MRDKYCKYIIEMLPFYFEILTQYLFSTFSQKDYFLEDIYAYLQVFKLFDFFVEKEQECEVNLE
jgi:hypothetical protein